MIVGGVGQLGTCGKREEFRHRRKDGFENPRKRRRKLRKIEKIRGRRVVVCGKKVVRRRRRFRDVPRIILEGRR